MNELKHLKLAVLVASLMGIFEPALAQQALPSVTVASPPSLVVTPSSHGSHAVGLAARPCTSDQFQYFWSVRLLMPKLSRMFLRNRHWP